MSELVLNNSLARRQSFAGRTRIVCRIIIVQAWRIAVFVVGTTILALGVVLLPLPGPGMLVVALGLGVLSVEFAWARRGIARLRATVAQLRQLAGERLAIASPADPPAA